MISRGAITCAISAACVTGGALLAATTMAGPDKIAFPEGFEKGVLYATVDRYDIKQHRELYSTPEAVKAVREGRPIPSGTVLTLVQYQAQTDPQGNPTKGPDGKFVKGKLLGYTVMEKRKGWGAEYPAEWRNGEWEYAAFTVDKKPNEKANANAKNCFVCHKPHEKQDFVISLASLAGKFPGATVAKKTGLFDVNIASFVFGPTKASVPAGKAVTWTNIDDSPHQISVKGQPKTAVLLKGQSASLTFDQPGLFDYICSLHPGMKGQVEVK